MGHHDASDPFVKYIECGEGAARQPDKEVIATGKGDHQRDVAVWVCQLGAVS